MAKQKINYKRMTVDQVVAYHNKKLLAVGIAHLLTIPLVAYFSYLTYVRGYTLFMFAFFMLGVLAYNYAVRTYWKVKSSDLNMILLRDCDPKKYAAVFEILKKYKFQPYSADLNRARGYYYAGEFQKAKEIMDQIQLPKPNSPRFFQYYSTLANIADALGDTETLMDMRERTRSITVNLKPKSNKAANGRQLLNIIDNMLAIHNNNYHHSRETAEALMDIASYSLSRITAAYRLAKLDVLIGAYKSAIERCEYIIDDGGTTFFVKEAKEMLEICHGKRSKTAEEIQKQDDAKKQLTQSYASEE